MRSGGSSLTCSTCDGRRARRRQLARVLVGDERLVRVRREQLLRDVIPDLLEALGLAELGRGHVVVREREQARPLVGVRHERLEHLRDADRSASRRRRRRATRTPAIVPSDMWLTTASTSPGAPPSSPRCESIAIIISGDSWPTAAAMLPSDASSCSGARFDTASTTLRSSRSSAAVRTPMLARRLARARLQRRDQARSAARRPTAASTSALQRRLVARPRVASRPAGSWRRSGPTRPGRWPRARAALRCSRSRAARRAGRPSSSRRARCRPRRGPPRASAPSSSRKLRQASVSPPGWIVISPTRWSWSSDGQLAAAPRRARDGGEAVEQQAVGQHRQRAAAAAGRPAT